MKKNLLVLLFAAALLAGAQNANAQLANGCIAPNFNATDINGNTWNLYSILDQGKTVFIDISATWCGPCWAYHNSGNLENLYNLYGPSGTNELMVFFIEGDNATTNADLHGTGSNTQGDWVTGTPYPIIDNASIASSYAITYFPTIYMVTPDRICRENSQISTAAHYAAMQMYAFPAIATTDAGVNWGCAMNQNIVNTGCSPSVAMSVRLFNYSNNPLTSATLQVSVNSVVQATIPWTGNLATYSYATINIPGITGSALQSTAVVTVTSANGGPDTRAANDVTNIPFTWYSGSGGPSITESFPVAFPPSGWALSNGGDAPTWEYATAGFNGAGSAKMDFYYSPAGNIDAFTLPPMDFSAYNFATLTFDRAHKMYDAAHTDNLKIKISTNCGNSWTTVYNKTANSNLAAANNLTTVAGFTTNPYTPTSASDWLGDNVNLNTYVGNAFVLVKFEALSGYGNNLYIDNINVNLTTSTGDVVTVPVQFEMYPNPASTSTSVSMQLGKASDVTVNVVNALGQVVQSTFNPNMSAAEHSFTINTENLIPGIYNVNVISSEGIVSHKLIKNK